MYWTHIYTYKDTWIDDTYKDTYIDDTYQDIYIDVLDTYIPTFTPAKNV